VAIPVSIDDLGCRPKSIVTWGCRPTSGSELTTLMASQGFSSWPAGDKLLCRLFKPLDKFIPCLLLAKSRCRPKQLSKMAALMGGNKDTHLQPSAHLACRAVLCTLLSMPTSYNSSTWRSYQAHHHKRHLLFPLTFSVHCTQSRSAALFQK